MATTLPTKSQLTGNVTEGQFKSGLNQLIDYLSENVGSGSTTGKDIFTTSGTFTVPAGVTQLYVSGCGAGGGGSTIFGCGGGAGASAYRTPITVTAGQSITVTIGTGGIGNKNASPTTNATAASNTDTHGYDGGSTSFGSYLTLAGGAGAVCNPSACSYYGGAAGGYNATKGEMPKMSGWASSSNYTYVGGKGGSCIFGAGGTGGGFNYDGSNYFPGDNGAGWGSGGGGGGACVISGSWRWTVAGAGANGIIIIEY